jgi:Fanconi-associated nuclease 1
MKRLENLLKLDKSERRRCQYKQKRHQTRQIEGERIWEEPEDLQTRKPVRPVLQDAINLTEAVVSEGELKSSGSCGQLRTRPPEVTLAWKKGKSVWKGRDGEEVTVEGLSLQHYEKMGFKG